MFCVRQNRVEDLYSLAGHFIGLARETISAEQRTDDNQLDFRERIADQRAARR